MAGGGGKTAIKVGSSLLGAAIGAPAGPAGMAAGAAIASGAASGATGDSLGRSLMNAGISGAGSFAAGSLGEALKGAGEAGQVLGPEGIPILTDKTGAAGIDVATRAPISPEQIAGGEVGAGAGSLLGSAATPEKAAATAQPIGGEDAWNPNDSKTWFEMNNPPPKLNQISSDASYPPPGGTSSDQFGNKVFDPGISENMQKVGALPGDAGKGAGSGLQAALMATIIGGTARQALSPPATQAPQGMSMPSRGSGGFQPQANASLAALMQQIAQRRQKSPIKFG